MNMNNPVFGSLNKIVDAWLCEVPWVFSCSGTEYARIYLRAEKFGPSDTQREIFCELKQRYVLLWPEIATKLTELTNHNQSDLSNLLKPGLMISIPGLLTDQLTDFVLTYEFKESPNPNTGYFMDFIDWRIVHAVEAA